MGISCLTLLFGFHRDAESNAELYLKAADCLQVLGEVGLESDNYEQAIEDFEACLRIQQEMLPDDSRATAETNYHLGSSHSYMADYEKSAAYFADSLQVRAHFRRFLGECMQHHCKPTMNHAFHVDQSFIADFKSETRQLEEEN